MQTKIRNLGLESKQQRLSEARAAYAAEKERLSTLYGPAQELRSEAEAAQDVVNRKVSMQEARVRIAVCLSCMHDCYTACTVAQGHFVVGESRAVGAHASAPSCSECCSAVIRMWLLSALSPVVRNCCTGAGAGGGGAGVEAVQRPAGGAGGGP
jgi:hypothetical protein